jgi:hypothetical protein
MRRLAGVSRRKRLVGARLEAEAGEVSVQIMLRRRRRKPVYLVYDEDAFLAAPNSVTAAPVTGAPSAGRPHARRPHWTGALLVTLAAATTAQFVASRLKDNQGPPSLPADGHARAASNHRRPAITRARRGRVEQPVTSLSASLIARARPRTEHHRHARRAQRATGTWYRTPLAGARGRAPIHAARPFSPTPRPQPAAIRGGAAGTRAAHEFGFED